MNIEKSLKEVGEHFKQKILKGDFEIISIREHTANIIIDKTYKFELWLGRYPESYFDIYSEEDGILYNYIKFNSNKERLQGYSHIKKYLNTDGKAKQLKEAKKVAC